MNRYQEEYNRKLTTVEGALSHIKSGDCVAHSLATLEPETLLSQLHTLHGKVHSIRVLGALEMGMYPYRVDPTYRDTFQVDSMFFMAAARKGHKEHIVSHIPTHLHNIGVRQFSHYHPNVALVVCTPMDQHGYLRMSLCNIYEQDLVEEADIVIAEVNPNLPIVGGETELHISQIDHLVEVNTPIQMLPRGEIAEIDRVIGEYVSSLVNDGDTVQLGIGSIPDAAAQAFMGKKDLGIHTEMITNSMADLVEAGVVTGRRKSLHRGKVVGTVALGDEKLYAMMNNNPSVVLLRGSYVNDPDVIARNDNMVSINTCVSVDLTGQVCSESLGALQYSGSGGQNDTAYGAIHAKNGRSIIALHSTAKNGTISAIAPVLAPGSVVTLSRNNVDYIVTEYGVAPMRGRSVRERVNNLIAVAHPDFRAQLRADAEKYKIW